jgi:hypothetical protein
MHVSPHSRRTLGTILSAHTVDCRRVIRACYAMKGVNFCKQIVQLDVSPHPAGACRAAVTLFRRYMSSFGIGRCSLFLRRPFVCKPFCQKQISRSVCLDWRSSCIDLQARSTFNNNTRSTAAMVSASTEKIIDHHTLSNWQSARVTHTDFGTLSAPGVESASAEATCRVVS